MFNNNCIDKTKNKVYINPNFNRTSINSIQPSISAMHVNPRFTQFTSNGQPTSNINPKAKIHVNPNFMKTKATVVCDNNLQSIVVGNNVEQTTVLMNSNSFYHHQPSVEIEKKKLDTPVTISRYSLLRPNVSKSCEMPVIERVKNTFQVNKYKSIPLKDIKKNLDNVKNSTCKQTNVSSQLRIKSNLSTSVVNGNQFKLVNPTIVTSQIKGKINFSTSFVNSNQFKLVNPKIITSQIKAKPNISTSSVNRNKFKLVNHNILKIDKNKTRASSDLYKKVQVNQCKVKKLKGPLKKNNIPCPMFRKFGKCLRQVHGNCEFLHDKKHVSICRKFIKGLCHDKDCLLSHDLTKKKMPTCYFYLQGSCTRSDCPYLHVKLSEKVKICPDFVKGYCEKGAKCLLRHVSHQTEKRVKESSAPKSSSIQKRKYTKIKPKLINPKDVSEQQQNDNKEKVNDNQVDCRYYQEHKGNDSESESCEIIKPTRCKLGTLPSFIQL